MHARPAGEGDALGGATSSHGQVGMMLQEVGAEYGTTTGRRRRCGWLDLASFPRASRASALFRGLGEVFRLSKWFRASEQQNLHLNRLLHAKDSLNITKLDVLTGLKQIRIAIAYRRPFLNKVLVGVWLRNRRMTEVRLPSGYFPSHLDDLKVGA